MLWINNIALTGATRKNRYWNILTFCNRRSYPRVCINYSFGGPTFWHCSSSFDPSLQETQDFTDLQSYFTFKINYWKYYLPFKVFDIKISILSFSLNIATVVKLQRERWIYHVVAGVSSEQCVLCDSKLSKSLKWRCFVLNNGF